VIADLLEDDLSTASFDGKTWSNPHHHGGHAAGHFIKWHAIKNQPDSVTQDVRRIREHPLVPTNVPVYGYVYDVRSLVISHKLLGTQEWFVIHHTNCGMELFADEVIADLLEDDLSTASFDGKTWSNPHHHGGHAAGHFIKWHTIKNQPESVTQDVRRIREHPLVPTNVPVYGYVYDVRTGRLDEVKTATEAGRAAA
jgi:carbonic anhydrase